MEEERNFGSRERFQKHHEYKKEQGYIPSPSFLNTAAPVVYFVGFLGIFYIGITDALPNLYKDSDLLYLRINQLFSWIVAFEIMINWYCIRYVDSCYKPSAHGRKQTSANTENGFAMKTVQKADDTSKESQSCGNCYNNTSNGTKQRKKVFKMLVATSLPSSEGKIEQKAFNYWSWTPCVVCQHQRPPRCHHCVLCQKCVLKRDHHCYFAGACIGVNNQRNFIVFLFWMFIGSVYSFGHMVPYAYFHVLPKVSYIDFIAPITFVRALLGYQTYFVSFESFLGWCLMCSVALTAAHLMTSVCLVMDSQTTFEQSNDMNTKDTRTNRERIRSVFGDNWALSFMLPCHWLYPPVENPVLWPNIIM